MSRARPFRLLAAVVILSAAAHPGGGQNEDRAYWENFLRTARLETEVRLGGPGAVTNPWKMRLEKDGVVRHALWKDVDTIDGGVHDFWRYEIAAYRLNALLELHLIPPTVERRLQGKPGSLQLWVEEADGLKSLTQAGSVPPPEHQENWNRTACLERAFDSLIANCDRNANNILVGADWKMILIDHSRSFGSGPAAVEPLMFGDKGRFRAPDGSAYAFWPLPRTFVDRIKALTEDGLRRDLRPYLTPKEIAALLARRTCLLAELDAAAAIHGEDKVYYGP